MTHPALLTATEAGVLLGLSSSTVRRRTEAGELATVRRLPGSNGAWLYARGEVLRYAAVLADREQAKAATA